jgi:hypothetical protein
MRNSKLGRIIDQLTKKEKQIIQGSILSPILDGKDYHQALFIYLISLNKKSNNVTRDEINKKIYKNKITDAQLRLHMSELYRIISLALVLLKAKDDPYYQDEVLIDRYKDNEDEKLYDSQFTLSTKRLENYPYRNADYHELKFELGFKKGTHISNSSRTRDLNLQELLDDLDHISISKKLRQACFAIGHNSVYGQSYNYGLLQKYIEYIEKNDLTKIPSIRLYYSGYKMLSTPKEAEFFNEFKKDIDELKHLFPDDELQGIYRFAINQCIRLLNRGNLEYGNISLDLYQEALENKYLMVEGHLSRFTYRNIAAIAVKIGEYDRAESFTSDHKSDLKKEEQNSAYHFNLALISYHRQDFDTALSSLQIVDFKDHLFNLAAKVIQMKVYYESEEYDLLESHLDAMQMYILRKKVIGYHKINYKNIIKMSRKLLKTNKNDRQAVSKLSDEINSLEVLTEKKWLLSRL